MNNTEAQESWKEQKGKLKQRCSALADNELEVAEVEKEEMFGKLQVKLGKTKEELHKIIQEL